MKNINKRTTAFVLMVGFVFGLIACKKDTITPPTVKVFEGAITLNYTGANVSAEVTDQGGAEVKSRGFVYGISDENLDTIFCGGGIGVYSAELNNLQPNTTYVYEAFAKNVGGTGTSGKVTFTTRELEIPTVKTANVENVEITTASCKGNVTNDGGAEVTERGVCWSTNHNPTMSENHVSAGGGLGEYTCNLTNLSVNTKYYVRAYAKNSKGTAYGEEKFFTTLDYGLPEVITINVTDITQTSVKVKGEVTNDGGTMVIERGVCWSSNHNPTINNHKVTAGEGMGSFTASIAGLNAHTNYYVRAYATNNKGTVYGDEVSFATLANLPTVTTSNITNITSTSATGKGNVTNDGGSAVTERGICWSTNHNPTISSNHNNSGTGTGEFTVNMTALAANTTYYVRAYAINNQGTAYGDEVNFKTNTISKPTVTTNDVTNITQTTAYCGGSITDDGGATVTAKGLCWSTSQNPTINNSHTTNGTGTSSFTTNITGLTANNTYYVRAYATNSAGTGYGEQRTFTTSNVTLPTVTTNNVTSITQTTAVCGGNVTNAGGGTITRRGIVWSTHTNPTLSDQGVNSGTGTGSFTASMTGLTAGTTYYVRAFAVNSAGTAYGAQKSFTTAGSASEGWLYYGDWNNHLECWGLDGSGTVEWAVMFPTSILSQYAGTSITRVDTYLGETGAYTLKIYKGGTSQPTTLVKTVNFNVTTTGWVTINVSPTTLVTTSTLWVSITTTHNAGQYPAGACAGVNNPNARWWKPNGQGWMDICDDGGEDTCFEIQTWVTNQAKGEEGLEMELPQIPVNPQQVHKFKASKNPHEGPKKYK